MKNTILKLITLVTIITFSSITTGCVSMWSHSQWKEAKSKQAIKVQADGEQVLVGVDVTALDYVKENPGIATLAALADAALIIGTYSVAKDALDVGGDGGNDGGNNNTDDGGAGRDNNDNDSSVININVNQ